VAAKVSHLRNEVRWHRHRTWQNQDIAHVPHTRTSYSERWAIGERYLHWVKRVWNSRRLEARTQAQRYVRHHTLHDWDDWRMAVTQAQRPFPGTSSWLLSCSDAEGGWGSWVRYGGGSYYAGYEDTNSVGGWMQFRPNTFYSYVYTALAHVRSLGYFVPRKAASWFSPLGQALTAAYMYTHGGRSHWFASVGNGC
jgi:hypothetical protein